MPSKKYFLIKTKQILINSKNKRQSNSGNKTQINKKKRIILNNLVSLAQPKVCFATLDRTHFGTSGRQL